MPAETATFETKKVNQLDLLPCPICGQKVLEEDQSQHEFWDIKCLRTHAWNSCGNWKKAKEIARRIRELREYKFDLKRAEDAFLAASRPGASCKAKPCKAQAKKELRKSKMKRETLESEESAGIALLLRPAEGPCLAKEKKQVRFGWKRKEKHRMVFIPPVNIYSMPSAAFFWL